MEKIALITSCIYLSLIKPVGSVRSLQSCHKLLGHVPLCALKPTI